MRLTALFAALIILGASAPSARALEAAAAKVDITPDLAVEKTYMAGFGPKGRHPKGVHDPLYARLIVLREGKTTVAMVGLDLLGFYLNETRDLEKLWCGGDENKHLFLNATHTHSGPDTLGLWGPMIGVSGVNPRYQARIKNQIAEALKGLEQRLRPVTAAGAHGLLNPRGLCRDSRDPQVIDPHLSVLRLTDRDGKTAATIVNWSCHPEVLGRDNLLLTADYPGPLCARVEEKTGGACLFLSGAIGGLMTPDGKAESFEEMARIGKAVADEALALKTGASRGGLGFLLESVRIPVENSRYRLFLPALAFGHRIFSIDGREISWLGTWLLSLRHLLFGLSEKNQPWVMSVVSVVDIGPARVLGMPAEIFPELAIGGYDGRYAFGWPPLALGEAPDLTRAPKGPYLRDLIKAPVPMLGGLVNDELGYLVPEYDFKVRASKSMLPRLPGHYEETNSIGPSATRILTSAAARLLKKARP